MEVEPPAPTHSNMRQADDLLRPEDTVRATEYAKPPNLTEELRSKSDQGLLNGMVDESPPRLNEQRIALSSAKDAPLLSLEETTELFRIRIEDARRDTQQLAGSEEVSEVVKPKLTLDLGHSLISRLPEAVVDLMKTEVERLSLSHNQIWHIPLRFSECTHLRYLNIRSNVFREIPRGVYKLPLLEILDISRNKVRKVPKDIANLTSLRVFSFVHNRIDDLPTEICGMTKLQVIKVSENPLKANLKEIVRAKEAELSLSDVTDNEREQAVTSEIKRYLRELHPVTPAATDGDSLPLHDDSPQDTTPKPLKRVVSSRFPVVPSGASMDASSELQRSSPNSAGTNKPPPIPVRSHFRGASGQTSNPRRTITVVAGSQAERNRSNSETAPPSASGNGNRGRRISLLRKETSDGLDVIDETKLSRQSHLRGFSHGSMLKRNGSVSSPFVNGESPKSPWDSRSTRTPTTKRLSSLPESKAEGEMSSPVVDGAKGLLYSLHQIEIQIRGLISVVEGREAKRTSLEFTFYNASRWLKRLNKALDKAAVVDVEDNTEVEKVQDAVQQNCADCVMAYKHVISQLQDNVKTIVGGTDPRYIRTLMLLLFGSVMEIRNAMKSFGLEVRSHKRHVSGGGKAQIATIPEEFTTPERQVRIGTLGGGRGTTRPQGSRLRSETTIQRHEVENSGLLQGAQPVQPPPSLSRTSSATQLSGHSLSNGLTSITSTAPTSSYGYRSRSNSRTNFTSASNSTLSSVANTPRSGDGFNLPPPTHLVQRINPVTGMAEAEEEYCFEQIYLSLIRSYEHALQALPIAEKQFKQCLEAAEEIRQPKSVLQLWQALIQRCKHCIDSSEALQIRLTNMPHKDTGYGLMNAAGGRNDPSFWLLCKTFLQSFVDLVTEMREAKERRLLPPNTLHVLRPVQKASRDAGKLIESSPWRSLTDGVGTFPPATSYNAAQGNAFQRNGYIHSVNGNQYPLHPAQTQMAQPIYSLPASYTQGLGAAVVNGTCAPSQISLNLQNTIAHGQIANGATPAGGMAATPLTAALGPAAQATIPNTPASAYGDQFFKGDVFQRADSLLSMPQAGSVNFLNRR